ncbi:hypothetical protein R6Q59_033441 [Mikania micrantha]
MYIKTRTRKDGSIVDDEAARVVTSLKAIKSDSTNTFRDQDDLQEITIQKLKDQRKEGMFD